MSQYYEIDFHEVGEKNSGDAISLRYGDSVLGTENIHVVDGGYSDDGVKVLDHISKYYKGDTIDNMILTHPDSDHASGLKIIIPNINVNVLWMNRPWLYVDELIPLFEHEYTRDGLVQRLKKNFPHTAELEKIAEDHDVEIREVFQGQEIGPFTILSPSKSRYINLIVHSEKTPEPEREASYLGKVYEKTVNVVNYVKSLWGHENLKGDTHGTSNENEMSVIQFAEICGDKILLTGDAGVGGLEEAYQYVVNIMGITLPALNRFQVPHHGARRNLSTEILDKWLGKKLQHIPEKSEMLSSALISANINDPEHPKKDVIRALWHRGSNVITTEKCGGFCYWFKGVSLREGCDYAPFVDYPEEIEE